MEDNQLKVLVVDDNEDDIFLVKEMIKEELPESNITLDYERQAMMLLPL